MRLAITIGRVDDKWQFIGQPGEAQEQKNLFREIRASGGKHGKTEFHEVRTFSEDGAISYKHTFDSDAQKQAHAARQAADRKTFEAAKAKREKDAAKVNPVKSHQLSAVKQTATKAVVAEKAAAEKESK